MSSKEDELIDQFKVKSESKWIAEEEIELETLQKSRLKLSRIVYNESDPPKRCIALSKNRKSVAFDIEMIPVVIATLKKITPKQFIPENMRDKY